MWNKPLSEDYISRASEIQLWLNSYEDIFSDFDPRPYKVKALSSDFLEETKRASFDKGHPLVLTLLLPQQLRKRSDEAVIKKRLKEHFKKHATLLKKEKWEIIKNGMAFAGVGLVLMFLATYILFTFEEKSFLTAFLVVLIEPGGWFLFWEGLNQVIFESKIKAPDYAFYEKMSGSSIYFRSI